MANIFEPGDIYSLYKHSTKYVVLVVGVSVPSETRPEYNVICLYSVPYEGDPIPSSSSILGRLHSSGELYRLGFSGYKALIQEMVAANSFAPLETVSIRPDLIESGQSYSAGLFPLSHDTQFPDYMEPWLPYIRCLFKPPLAPTPHPSIFL